MRTVCFQQNWVYAELCQIIQCSITICNSISRWPFTRVLVTNRQMIFTHHMKYLDRRPILDCLQQSLNGLIHNGGALTSNHKATGKDAWSKSGAKTSGICNFCLVSSWHATCPAHLTCHTCIVYCDNQMHIGCYETLSEWACDTSAGHPAQHSGSLCEIALW